MPQKPAARLTQRRYYDDPEVRGRAPARGQSWIPPLGPPRKDGPLEPPVIDDTLDDTLDDADAGVIGAQPTALGVAATTATGDDATAAALLDDMGEYDPAASFLASVSGA